MSFEVFKRRWWKDNPAYPKGLEPEAGEKTVLGTFETREEAIAYCKDWNDTHEAGRYSVMAEFTALDLRR